MLTSLAQLFLAALLFAPAQETVAPSQAEVESRIADLQGVESDAAKKELAVYAEALEALKRTDEARALARGFRSDVDEAPARLQNLRAELAEVSAAPELVVDPGLDLREREQRLAQAEADLSAARAQTEELARLATVRQTRITSIPDEIARAQQQLDEQLELLPSLAATPDTQARRARLAAEIDALYAQVDALNAEKAAYEALREVLPLRREKAQRQATRAQKVVEHWRAQATKKRSEEAELAAAETQRQTDEILRSFPELESVARRNEELAAMRSGEDGLPQRIGIAKRTVLETRSRRIEVTRRYSAMKRRISAGGLTESMGLVLRRDYEWLPTQAELNDEKEANADRLSAVNLLLLVVEEERAVQSSVEQQRAEIFQEFQVEEPTEQLAELATRLLAKQRELQGDVIEEASALLTALLDLKVAHDELTTAVKSYRDYIEQRILWVRSVGANPLPSLLDIPEHAYALVFDTDWPLAVQAARQSLDVRIGRSVLVGLAFTLLIALRPILRRKRREMAELVRSYHTDKFLYTIRALVQSFLLALPFPLLVWWVSWILSQGFESVARPLGTGMREIASVYLVLELVRQVAKTQSVGEGHLRWSERAMKQLRTELRWFQPPAIALGWLALTFDHQQTIQWTDSLGRGSFVAVMIALAFFLYRVFRADSPILSQAFQRGRSLLGRTRRVWTAVAVGMPIALAVTALSGYYYTALQLETRLRYSLGFAAGLTLVNALLLRWLFITRRRLAIEQARQRAKAKAAAEEKDADAARESGSVGIDEDAVDIPSVDAQTRQLFRSGLTIAAVVGVYLIWAGALPALGGLDRVQFLPELAILDVETPGALEPAVEDAAVSADAAASTTPGTSGSSPISTLAGTANGISNSLGLPSVLTLADVILAAIFGLLATIAAKNLPGLLEISLLQRLPLDSGSRYALSTIIRYLIIIIGISAVSTALGLGWEKIQWLAAALTFGLAFGLQEIFANFVSGLIILIERPVRVGDIVTVGGTEGRVTRLRMRATTIQDWDRREYLVPNKEFITGSITNWTLTDPVTRMVIPVGIAYGSDTKKARKLLMKVARENTLVLEEPPPSAIFRGFGDSSLNFELRVFLANRDLWPEMIDRLHSEIDFAFREADIEIAFPQRDLHIRSVHPEARGARIEPESESD